MKMTCIMCPVGCQLEVEQHGKTIVVRGNSCSRGKEYGERELLHPARIVTALVHTDRGVLPVKTTDLVPKDAIVSVLAEIGNLQLPAGKSGDVILKNVLGLGVDVIITGDYQA